MKFGKTCYGIVKGIKQCFLYNSRSFCGALLSNLETFLHRARSQERFVRTKSEANSKRFLICIVCFVDYLYSLRLIN